MALQIIDKVPMRVVEDTIHGYFVMQKIALNNTTKTFWDIE